MWQFSLILNSEHSEIAKEIYKNVKKNSSELNCVITSFEKLGQITISFACNELERNKFAILISNAIIFAICSKLKLCYLEENLKKCGKNDLENYLFKKALECFDRETDRYIVNKNLYLENNMFLNFESFFHFKLKSLKEKWQELVEIANDNNTYFLSDDSFLELIRFLVDNIEYCTEEINVIFKDNKISVFDKDNQTVLGANLDEISLVDKLLELSPKKINWYRNSSFGFLEKVFDKRIVFYESNSQVQYYS